MPEYSLSMLPVLNPLTFIIVSFGRFPSAKSIFHTILPLTFENFSIIPTKNSMTSPFAIFKLAYVNTIYISLAARSFNISFIPALKYLPFTYANTLSMLPELIIKLSKINSFLTLLNFEIRPSCYFLDIKILPHIIVTSKIVSILFFFWNSKQPIR